MENRFGQGAVEVRLKAGRPHGLPLSDCSSLGVCAFGPNVELGETILALELFN